MSFLWGSVSFKKSSGPTAVCEFSHLSSCYRILKRTKVKIYQMRQCWLEQRLNICQNYRTQPFMCPLLVPCVLEKLLFLLGPCHFCVSSRFAACVTYLEINVLSLIDNKVNSQIVIMTSMCSVPIISSTKDGQISSSDKAFLKKVF